jgi:hypothetical protein
MIAEALVATTRRVSLGSAVASPVTWTVNVRLVTPGAKVSVCVEAL